MKRMIEELDTPLTHDMTTNGYLLDQEKIAYFREFPLSEIQITLDGKRERHDSIRRLSDGTGTYGRIIGNIDNVLHALPDTRVAIRVNVDKHNFSDYYDIYDELTGRWEGLNVDIYPGFIYVDDNTGKRLSCGVYDGRGKSERLLEIRDRYRPDDLYPSLHNAVGCCATQQNAYIVVPGGALYKCWRDVGDTSRSIGNIVTGKVGNTVLLYRYLQASKWYNREECRECKLLPICDGGCAADFLRYKYEGYEEQPCGNVYNQQEMLDKYLEAYFNHKQK